MNRFALILTLVLLTIMVYTSCDKKASEDEIPVIGVSLNESTITLTVGETEQLIATIFPDNATNQNVTWYDGASSIATVDNGMVTAQSVGFINIVVATQDGHHTAYCTVIVRPKDEDKIAGIEDISFENYPKVDGSTSASVLNTMVACKLLDVPYGWGRLMDGDWSLYPFRQVIPEPYQDDFFLTRVMASQTHGAFMNLIDGNADIILTHRTISPDEKAHADALGVTLIETPIALDAFVFVVNKNSPVKSLTVSQIQKIYTREITNWSQVGGNNASINVYTRPRNSGSEEVFRELVMNGIEPADFPYSSIISSMSGVFLEMLHENAICYSFYTFKELQARIPDSEVPVIAINGVFPDKNTVKDRTYPLISEVHVAIRSDLDRNSMAYKLYEWLQAEEAKSTILECGFITK